MVAEKRLPVLNHSADYIIISSGIIESFLINFYFEIKSKKKKTKSAGSATITTHSQSLTSGESDTN